jgi:hypothetical protein
MARQAAASDIAAKAIVQRLAGGTKYRFLPRW